MIMLTQNTKQNYKITYIWNESNTSYDFDLTNGFKLTPAMRMTYHGNFSNVDEKQIMGQELELLM